MINWTGKAAAKNRIYEMLRRRGLPEQAADDALLEWIVSEAVTSWEKRGLPPPFPGYEQAQ